MYDNHVTRLHDGNANDDVHINIFLFQRNPLAPSLNAAWRVQLHASVANMLIR